MSNLILTTTCRLQNTNFLLRLFLGRLRVARNRVRNIRLSLNRTFFLSVLLLLFHACNVIFFHIDVVIDVVV